MTELFRAAIRQRWTVGLTILIGSWWIAGAGGPTTNELLQAADPARPQGAAGPAQPAVLPPGAPPVAAPGGGQVVQAVQFRAAPKATDSDDTPETEGVFDAPIRERLKQLERAKQLSQQGRYSDALQLLDDIIESSDDHFFHPPNEPTAQRGLKAEARRLISEQADEGLQAYETLFGTKAQKMLDEALAGGDMNAVAEVARRYFNTQAGYQATLLLGHYHLDHNQPLAAALNFQRLHDTRGAAARFEPSLSVLLAVAWVRGGVSSRAEEVLKELKQRQPGAMIPLDGRQVALFAAGAQPLPWLTTLIGAQPATSDAKADSWAIFRGNPARNAASLGGTPLLNPRWRVPTTEYQAAERAVVTARQDNLDRNIPILPVMQPLAVQDVILMRTSRSLLAVDFATGKRVWEVYPRNEAQADRAAEGNRHGGAQAGQGDPMLGEKLWENATIGTLASDDQYVFAVEDSGNALLANEPPRVIVRPNGAVRMLGDRPSNELAAFELRTQGKRKWTVGGDRRDLDTEPKLTGAYFLGPPLPLMGNVYALAEIKGDIRLVVLAAKTGKLQWDQLLASVDQNELLNSFRRLAGVSPSYADGVLVCPTAAGAVVGVDLANRSLLWGFEYPHNQQIPQQQMMAIRMGVPVTSYGVQGYFGDRWADATAAIVDGHVLLTPIESDQLFCLNLLDGRVVWKQDRGENVYVACVQDGKVVLVGRRQVKAVNLADGSDAWSHPLELPGGGMPSGRGFLSDKTYFLPLSTAEVVKIDLATGQIVGRAKSRKGLIPGNLICYKKEIVSQGVDSLDTFFQLEPLKERITATLAQSVADPWALARRGEIALEEGQLSAAVDDLRPSYNSDLATANINPATASSAEERKSEEQRKDAAAGRLASTRELLFDALLGKVQQDFAASRGDVAELEKLVILDSQRDSLQQVIAVGLQKQGDRLGALEAYLKLADLQWGQGEPESVEANLTVRRDCWVLARVGELYAAASSAERLQIDALIGARLRTAREAKVDVARQLRRFLSFFGRLPVADEARQLLVAQLRDADTLLERESLLRELERSSDPAQRRAATARLAAFLSAASRPEEAAVYYRRLATDLADVVCLDGKTGRQLIARLPTDSAEARALAESDVWPSGRVKREVSGPRGMRNAYQQHPLTIEWRGDRGPLADTTVLFDQQQQQIVGRDGWGREPFRIPLNETNQNRMGFVPPPTPNLSFAAASGHLLLVDLGNQILALDTLRSSGSGSRIVWQQELVDQPPNMFNVVPVHAREITFPFAASRSVPGVVQGGPIVGDVGPVTAHCVCVARARDLTALDPLTGSVLWTRHGLTPGSEVFGDDEVLLVAPPDGGAALVLRTTDGQLLGTREVPAIDARWTFRGRQLVVWQKTTDEKFRLTLSDPWRQKETVMGEFAAGSKGTLVRADAVAMFEPTGRFVMMSLVDGRKLVDEPLDAEPLLQTIAVQETADQYVLIVTRPTRQRAQGRRPNVAPVLMGDPNNPLVSGHVVAFSRSTGKPAWSTSAVVEQYYALLGHGQDLPVLLFLRPTQRPSAQGSGELRSSVLCLDRRTGRALLDEELSQPLNNFNFELSGDRHAQTVSLLMPNQTLTLHFTDEPTPPEPPYQSGLALRSSRLGSSPAGAVLRALGNAGRDSADDGDSPDDDSPQQ